MSVSWLADNLNINTGKGTWLHFAVDDDRDSVQYGRLYTWTAAKQACKQLGKGWRLPTDDEWQELILRFGGYLEASSNTTVGDSPTQARIKLTESGERRFSAMFGGLWNESDKKYNFSSIGYYWTASEAENKNTIIFFLSKDGGVYRSTDQRDNGLSCRCVKD